MRQNLRYLGTTVLICMALSMLCAALSAQGFSQILSFQGRLADPDTGKPLPDGQYQVTFRIFDAASEGTRLWQETQTVSQTGGIFSVCLGSVTQFPSDLFTDGDRWLSLQVSGDAEMAERFRFTPAPWALYAATSGPDGDWTISGANIYRETGKVGIGTTTPGNALHVVSGGQCAVFGDATAGSGGNYGVYGRLASTAGTGVYGEATAATGTANGVVGFTATLEGSGVFGQNTNHSGENEGVFGVAWSPQGKGVMGWNGSSSGDAIGVLGRTNSESGYGVYGEAQRTTGQNYGVYGIAHSDSQASSGVYGQTDGAGQGVRGYSATGWAVLGLSPNGSGQAGVVGAIINDTGGVLWQSNSGVSGATQDGYGVSGLTISGIGVYGRQEDSENFGYLGTSTMGVYGHAYSGVGVEAYNDASHTWADLATSTHAGYFYGDVHTTQEYTKAYTTGTANLATPIAYATVAADGSVLSGTPNVSCAWNAAQSRYEITISGENYFYSDYTTVVSPIASAVRIPTTNSASNKLLVYIFDGSGNKVQNTFQVVVYKP